MQNQDNTLFIGNMSFKTTADDLQKLFAPFGVISTIRIPTDFETGRPRGFAFITFEDKEAAQQALSLDNSELDGRPLKVRIAEQKPQNGPRPSNGGRSFGGNRSGGNGMGRSRY